MQFLVGVGLAYMPHFFSHLVLKYSDVAVEESEMSDVDLEALQSIVKERFVKVSDSTHYKFIALINGIFN